MNQHPTPAYRILCIGDSQTFGVGASAGFSYPEQLALLLNSTSPSPRVEVVNRGVPADNSSQILARLHQELAALHPQCVVILAGTNNAWNTTAASLPPPWRSGAIRWLNQLERLRLYRVAQWAFNGQAVRHGAVRLDDPVWWGYQRLAPEVAERMLEQLGRRPDDERKYAEIGKLCLAQRKFDEAHQAYQRVLAINPRSETAYVSLAIILMLQGQFGHQTEEWLGRALQINPRSAAAWTLLGHYHRIVGSLEQAQDDYRNAQRDPTQPLSIVNPAWQAKEPKRVTQYLTQWLRNDLEAMLRLVSRSQARVIFLTYPYAPSVSLPVSDVIRAVGAERHVPVVDLEALFGALPAAARSSLFSSDGSHPSAAGYRFIAEQVTHHLAPPDPRQDEQNLMGRSEPHAAGSKRQL